MRQLIVFITLAIIAIPQISYAEDEIIWQTEFAPNINDLIVAPQGDIFYNISAKHIQIRRVDDGVLIDSIILADIPYHTFSMSISADGRYMAITGDHPYVIIYDLQEKREIKRITIDVYEREELSDSLVLYRSEQWPSASISADGKRITGVSSSDEGNMTNFVVLDIETEEVLFEERRIGYDHYNPSDKGYEWISAEYTPDGNYIVAQLNYGEGKDVKGPDTTYIYDAHTFELHDKVLAYYIKSREQLEFSSYSPLFAFSSHDYKNKVSHIYDINTSETIYEYNVITIPMAISLDNSKMLGVRDGKIHAMKTFFTTTSVEDNQNEIVISPNPTSSIANISIDCSEPQINYQINDISGLLIFQSTIQNSANIQIDFTPYPNGVYLITFNCNQVPKTYKIIKEG